MLTIIAGIRPILLAVVGIMMQALSASATPLDTESTCFGSQIDHPHAASIARNTVFIARVRPDGTLISQATGFVVRGSAAGGASGPRIVTAAHVIDPNNDEPDDFLMVFLSDGTPLGVPRVVAMSEQKKLFGDVELVVDDLAVLEIARFSDAAARDHFAGIDGLSVRVGGTLMVGETGNPVGVIWGFSGAPAVDRDGQVVGVLTEADFRGRTTLTLGTIQAAGADGRPQSREVTLPSRSLVVVEPLHTPKILRELKLSEAYRSDRGETPVLLTGFPFASCASTSARLKAADSPDGAKLLKKWQSVGPVDAWLPPFAFSVTKLRLTPN